MLPSKFILTLALACVAAGTDAQPTSRTSASPPVEHTAPGKKQAPKKKPQEQHFCCADAWKVDKEYFGEDCDAIGEESVNTCLGSVLNCPGAYIRDQDGGVVCE